jgi:hypothetical protein
MIVNKARIQRTILCTSSLMTSAETGHQARRSMSQIPYTRCQTSESFRRRRQEEWHQFDGSCCSVMVEAEHLRGGQKASLVRHRIILSGSSRRSEYEGGGDDGRNRSCVSIVSVTCDFCSTPRLYHETLSCRSDHAADEKSNRWLFCLIDDL